MFGFFKTKSPDWLATDGERQHALDDLPQIFRKVDEAFHTYLQVVVRYPKYNERQLMRELVRRRISPRLAEECVLFGPMAWGRELMIRMGVVGSPNFRGKSLVDGSEWEQQLALVPSYAWARQMVPVYLVKSRKETFKLVSSRSAELHAISRALDDGVTEAELRAAELDPAVVKMQHAGCPY